MRYAQIGNESVFYNLRNREGKQLLCWLHAPRK